MSHQPRFGLDSAPTRTCMLESSRAPARRAQRTTVRDCGTCTAREHGNRPRNQGTLRHSPAGPRPWEYKAAAWDRQLGAKRRRPELSTHNLARHDWSARWGKGTHRGYSIYGRRMVGDGRSHWRRSHSRYQPRPPHPNALNRCGQRLRGRVTGSIPSADKAAVAGSTRAATRQPAR